MLAKFGFIVIQRESFCFVSNFYLSFVNTKVLVHSENINLGCGTEEGKQSLFNGIKDCRIQFFVRLLTLLTMWPITQQTKHPLIRTHLKWCLRITR